MDANDFKRLLEESAAETRREVKHLVEESSAETRREVKHLVEESSAETRREVKHLIEETHRRIDANAAETAARFDQVDARFEKVDARFDQVDARAAELKQHIDKTAAQMKLHFDLTVEHMRSNIQQVADGVLMVNEKFDREAADIRTEMRQGFAETQGLLRFSHKQLDERITALERAAK
jgi:methyl-accepting chemotaxis protein